MRVYWKRRDIDLRWGSQERYEGKVVGHPHLLVVERSRDGYTAAVFLFNGTERWTRKPVETAQKAKDKAVSLLQKILFDAHAKKAGR